VKYPIEFPCGTAEWQSTLAQVPKNLTKITNLEKITERIIITSHTRQND
jgi:hypothetical protein